MESNPYQSPRTDGPLAPAKRRLVWLKLGLVIVALIVALLIIMVLALAGGPAG